MPDGRTWEREAIAAHARGDLEAGTRAGAEIGAAVRA